MKTPSGLKVLLCVALIAVPCTAVAQYIGTFHVIPQVADGRLGNVVYNSAFFITKYDGGSTNCNLAFFGLSASRLLYTQNFVMDQSTGGTYNLTTAGPDFGSGFATLTCSQRVSVNTLYTSSASASAILLSATVFSVPPFLRASLFSWNNPPTVRLGIAIANPSDTTVNYQISLNNGGTITGKDLSIGPRSSSAKFLDEIIAAPSGVVIVFVTSQSLPLYMTGLLYNGAVFTTIPPTIYQ